MWCFGLFGKLTKVAATKRGYPPLVFSLGYFDDVLCLWWLVCVYVNSPHTFSGLNLTRRAHR